MPIRLTAAQQEAYERDGFVAPIDIFSADEAAAIRAALEEAGETVITIGQVTDGQGVSYSGALA